MLRGMAHSTIGVGVIGLGFMGRTHALAYQAAARDGFPCRLVAVADPDPERRLGKVPAAGNLGGPAPERLFDPGEVAGHPTPEALFADPSVQLVSICTYTDSHVELALKALDAGKHVLLEKPVALRSADVRRLADAARGATTRCMPAMCMRFWPGWDWLRERVRDGSLGKLRALTLQRLGAGPNWASEFYRDPERSGGALFDLHIHDADFVYWLFGPPRAVASAGTLLHHTTLYRFADPGLHVSAEGAWDLSPAAGFRMKYLATFEHATAEFEISRTPALMLHTREKSEAVALPAHAGYDAEVRHLVRAIAEGRTELDATLDDAVAVTRLLEAERESLRGGREVPFAG
jgi:predicted dehydrogenase